MWSSAVSRDKREDAILILSPTTGREDRQIKLRDYLLISPVQEILMVVAERLLVELWVRGDRDWHRHVLHGHGTLSLGSLGLELDLAAIYDGIVD